MRSDFNHRPLLILLLAGCSLASPPRGTAQSATESERGDVDRAAADRREGDPRAEGRVKVEERKSSKAALAKGEINFDDLKFEIEKDGKFEDGMLGPDIKQLVGRKVKLRGYILPSTLFKETNIEEFVLVRDNQECCFGPGAALFDCVIVKMQDGRTTDFVTRPVTVEGQFKIDTESYRYPGGQGPSGASHLAIFQIDGVSVK